MKLRHLAPLAALAMLLPAAAPEGEAVVECDTDVDVIVEGESGSYEGINAGIPDAGEVPHGQSQTEIVTVAGTAGETALKANITAVMSYSTPGDLELRAYDSSGAEIGNSTAFNPTDGYTETVTVSVNLCEEVTFVVENYLDVPGGPVTLDVTVEGKRPRKR